MADQTITLTVPVIAGGSIVVPQALNDGDVLTASVHVPVSGPWTYGAIENGTFTVPPNTLVRYGANLSFVEKTLSGTVVCNNATFGDPLPGIQKHCDYQVPAIVHKPVLVYSGANHATPNPAAGITFFGRLYLWLQDTNTASTVWTIDGKAVTGSTRDLGGTNADGTAIGFDTTTLTNGSHIFQAVETYSDSTTKVTIATTNTINNVGAPPALPAAPTSVTATPADSKVTLGWI